MTNTSHMQINPDFYTSRQICEENLYTPSVQTNVRYKNFNQTHFTAGDEEQFVQFMNNENCSIQKQNINLNKNLFSDLKLNFWHKYSDLEGDSIFNTFRYVFHKFKKGIFIKIENNKLKVFLPFSKSNYINEWSEQIKIDKSKYTSIENFIKNIYKKEGRKYNKQKINKNIEEWCGNNSLVRYEYPLAEGEKTISLVKVMFEELCKNREIPNISFFYNRRDFPLLTINETEPYNNIWGSKNLKLLSNNYQTYCPILSGSSSDRYADILLPTWDDWARVESYEEKWYKGTCKDYTFNFNTSWESKKPTAVFRGSTTGSGVTTDTNMRLKASLLSHSKKDNSDNYLDAGITKWNLRPRKHEKSEYLETIDISKFPFGLVDYLTPEEQSNYKYILNIDGHVSAYRLSIELSMNSVVLLVDSEWKLWFSYMLEPYVHYIPIKSDLSDLIEQVKWCRNNDKKCKEISKKSKEFYKIYLQKDGIFDYLQKILVDIKNFNGSYLFNTESLTDTLIRIEYKQLSYSYPSNYNKLSINNLNNLERNYGNLNAIQWLIRKVISENNVDNLIYNLGLIFENKLGKVHHNRFLDYNLAIKTTSDTQKIKEHIHETFIGTKITNLLSKYIPNFVYIFVLYKKDKSFNVVTEKIDGETLFSYLHSKSFDFQVFLFIIIQVCLSLQLAQNKYGFIHYDLTPWNIILKKLPKKIEIEYPLSHDNIFKIKTDILPVIIDFGKSHVIYNNIHHGYVKHFKLSVCQDYLTLLLNSVEILISCRKLTGKELNHIFILSNFITNTKYRKNKFSNIHDLKKFCRQSKKYGNLLDDNKYELEDLNPMDLINYILSKLSYYTFDINRQNNITLDLHVENPVQVYESFYLDSVIDIIKSCTNNIDRILKNIPDPTNNNIFNKYILHEILVNINSLYSKSIKLLGNTEKSKVLKKQNKITCEKLIHKYSFDNLPVLDVGEILHTKVQIYDELVFMNIRTVSELLVKSTETTNYIEYKDILTKLFLNKSLYNFIGEEIFQHKNILKILNLNVFDHLRFVCNNETLKVLSREIYQKNLKWLEKEIKNDEILPQHYLEYIKLYTKILS